MTRTLALVSKKGNIVAMINGKEIFIDGKNPADTSPVNEPFFGLFKDKLTRHDIDSTDPIEIHNAIFKGNLERALKFQDGNIQWFLEQFDKPVTMEYNKPQNGTPSRPETHEDHPAFDESAPAKNIDEEKKEFVIDVKGLDIKKEIKHATIDFVKIHAAAILETTLAQVVKEEVKALQPNYIKVGNRKEVKITGRTHKAFEECLFLAEQERQIFISGPAGSGKTTLGEQMAKAFNIPFYHISCSAGLSEAHLLGRMLFDGSYVPSDFIKCYEEGGIFLFDEIDAADSNTLLIINSALANGIVSVPNRKDNTSAKRHKDFICIASANTWGNGSFEYHGRNHLDAAFLDRFSMSKASIDYDKCLEKEICSATPEVSKLLWKIRDNCTKNKVRKIVSTRAFISGSRQVMAGKTLMEVKKRFFIGWTAEEIAKVDVKIEDEETVMEGGF